MVISNIKNICIMFYWFETTTDRKPHLFGNFEIHLAALACLIKWAVKGSHGQHIGLCLLGRG